MQDRPRRRRRRGCRPATSGPTSASRMMPDDDRRQREGQVDERVDDAALPRNSVAHEHPRGRRAGDGVDRRDDQRRPQRQLQRRHRLTARDGRPRTCPGRRRSSGATSAASGISTMTLSHSVATPEARARPLPPRRYARRAAGGTRGEGLTWQWRPPRPPRSWRPSPCRGRRTSSLTLLQPPRSSDREQAARGRELRLVLRRAPPRRPAGSPSRRTSAGPAARARSPGTPWPAAGCLDFETTAIGFSIRIVWSGMT